MSTGKELSSRLAAMALAVLALVGAAAAEDGERRIQGVLAPSISNHDDDGDWYLFIYGAEEATQCQHRASPSEMQEILNLGPGVVTVPIAQHDGSVVLWPDQWVRTHEARSIAHELRNWRYFPTREACLEEAQWAADKGATYYLLDEGYDGRARCRAVFKGFDPRECKNILDDAMRAGCEKGTAVAHDPEWKTGQGGAHEPSLPDQTADASRWYLFYFGLPDDMQCKEVGTPAQVQALLRDKYGTETKMVKEEDGMVTFDPLGVPVDEQEKFGYTAARGTILLPTVQACQQVTRMTAVAGLRNPQKSGREWLRAISPP